ncbi:glycine zipper family protein [Methylomonas methanica]|uniref:Uncharacterized protein n=1 Tax=Methylomonas methanica (strain DSM 25384 / MC09) TaxID=857087 RepID=G0A3C5_METMM|nr:glycine zipper family protein [Methylomonas methanica]AEG00224.1 hypothetical protein Metme_1806 [Methylomonas methanica MC09]
MKRGIFLVGFGLLGLVGCAHMPNGPSVMVLPGSRMSFEQFQQDDYECRQYASGSVGGSPNQAASESRIGSAVIGTALGAAAGAALGGGGGAAIGAGTGLVAGSLVGMGEGRETAYATQEGYDNAYIQCMYAKGHRVPISGQFSDAFRASPTASAPPIPPPPPGAPPPPPLK